MAPHSPADQFAQVDVNGHAWVAGYTRSSLDGHSNAGGNDIFLMKFDGEGVHQWTDQRGGKGDDYANALQAVRLGCNFVFESFPWRKTSELFTVSMFVITI